MPWYLNRVPKYLCEVCRAIATQQLFNSRNAPCGFYCHKHAKLAKDKANAKDV